jgi:hypothetical protein
MQSFIRMTPLQLPYVFSGTLYSIFRLMHFSIHNIVSIGASVHLAVSAADCKQQQRVFGAIHCLVLYNARGH